jgi:hypothetical protein
MGDPSDNAPPATLALSRLARSRIIAMRIQRL